MPPPTDSRAASGARRSPVRRLLAAGVGPADIQVLEVGNDDIGAVLPERIGVTEPVDADNETEAAATPRLDADDGVFDAGTMPGLDAEFVRSGQKETGFGL